MGKERVHVAHAEVPRTFVYSRQQRWTISIFAFTLHIGSFIYLICFAFVYHTIPNDQIDVLHLFAPRFLAIVYVFLSLLNFRCILWILFPQCTSNEIMIYDPAAQPISPHGKLLHFYIRLFSRYGLLGLHGELYDLRVTVKHLFQVSSQGYQAYQMSLYFTDPTTCVIYTYFLAFGCFFVPLLLFSQNSLVHRWGPAFADALVNFLLCAGIPLILLFNAIIDFYFSGNDTLLWDKKWLNQMIMLARAFTVTSFFEMVSTAFLFIMCFISLKNLHAAVHLRHSDLMSSRELSRKCAKQALGNITNQVIVLRYCRYVLVILSTLASIWFVSVATMAVSRETCPKGCVLQTYPWFSQKCNCVMVRVNCQLDPISVDIDLYIQNRLSNVFDLEIDQCDLPHGISPQTLQSLTNMYSINLRMTNTLDWSAKPSDAPSSLFVVYFTDQLVDELPTFLQDTSTNNLHFLIMRNISLPNGYLVPHYRDLYQFTLSNASLTEIPTFVYDLPDLTTIEVDNNKIESVPLQLQQLKSIQLISLSWNMIKSVPDNFFMNLPASLKKFQLDGNPIEYLPPDTNIELLLTSRLSIRHTSLCNRISMAIKLNQVSTLSSLEQQIAANHNAICDTHCSAGCFPKFPGNTVCESACLTSSCNYDTSSADFAEIGFAASDCWGVVTGWEPTHIR